METKSYALYVNFPVILFRFTLRLFSDCLGNKRYLSESLVHEKWKNAGHYNKDATDSVGNTSYIVVFFVVILNWVKLLKLTWQPHLSEMQ